MWFPAGRAALWAVALVLPGCSYRVRVAGGGDEDVTTRDAAVSIDAGLGRARWQVHEVEGALDLHAVWGSGSDDVFAVGDYGVVLHWDGRDWSSVDSGVSISLADVCGSSADDVWAMGEDRLLHTTGGAWTEVDPRADDFADFAALTCLEDGQVWVVAGLAVHHWDGVRWSIEAIEGWNTPSLAWAAGAGDVWLIHSFEDTFEHWTGAGWRLVDNGVGDLFVWWNCWGSGPTDVWVVGGDAPGAFAVHWDGTEWRASTTDQTDFFRGISGTAADDVYAVGWGGLLWRYDGQAWSSVLDSDFALPDLNDVWVSNEGDVWAVGDEGAIVRLE